MTFQNLTDASAGFALIQQGEARRVAQPATRAHQVFQNGPLGRVVVGLRGVEVMRWLCRGIV